MIKEIEFSAKTIEEAVALASQKLDIPAEKIEYTVLDEAKKGFLGIGSAEAKISVRFEPGIKEATEEFLKTFLKNANIEANLTCTEKEGGELLYTIDGEGMGAFIGHHGEVLEALQYLLTLVSNCHGNDFIRVSLDIENYREKRQATLRNLAGRTAQRVKKTGKNFTFEPMSAYERRIIHSRAQEIEGVTTYSIGSGDSRRVVMSLTDANQRRKNKPEKQSDKPKVVYEYNPVREPRKIVKAKSIEDINLADVEDTEMVNL